MKKQLATLAGIFLAPLFLYSFYFVFVANLGTPITRPKPQGNNAIKIRGLGFHSPSEILQTPELARSTGANWIHLKAMFFVYPKCQSFAPLLESRLRYYIRRAHRVGLKVMLVPFGASQTKTMPSDIRLPRSYWGQFYQCFTEQTLYWAKVAEEEKVEMFATANEPDRFTSEEAMSDWLQEILPKIRKIYSGKIAVGFYPSIHNWTAEIESGLKTEKDFEKVLNINVSGYDYLAPAGTPSGFETINQMHILNQKTIQRMRQVYQKWQVKFIILEVNAPESLRSDFWDKYLAKGMQRDEIRAMVFREWVKDFQNIDFVDGWFFIEWGPNNFFTFFETNPPEKKYTLDWQSRIVYDTIKQIYTAK